MKQKTSVKNELFTLSQLVKQPLKKAKTMGIILDATQPYKTGNSRDYLVKLKIIDDTLNIKNHQTLLESRAYFQIFIFAKQLDDIPTITNIGDIIYLKRYDFSFFNNNEIKGVRNQYANGNTYIFNGTGDDYEITSSDTIKQGGILEQTVTEQIQERINQLRKFSLEFFSQNSITKMSWYGIQQIDQNTLKQSDFDMVLKITQKESNQENKELIKYTLQDGQNNSFYLVYVDDENYQIGKTVKIRSVAYVNEKKELTKNDYSSILTLPEHFLDVLFFKSFQYDFIYPEEESEIIQDSINELNVYETDFTNKVSTIMKKYTQGDNYNVTDLLTLLQNKKKYQTNNKIQYMDKKYKVNCYVIDVQPASLKESLVYLCKSCKKSVEFSFQENVQCCGIYSVLFMELYIIVKDKSIDNIPEILEAYVYPFDNNPSEFFPNLDIKNIKTEQQLEEAQLKYDSYRYYLFENTTLSTHFECILSPLFYQNQMIYRVIDTKVQDIITPALQENPEQFVKQKEGLLQEQVKQQQEKQQQLENNNQQQDQEMEEENNEDQQQKQQKNVLMEVEDN